MRALITVLLVSVFCVCTSQQAGAAPAPLPKLTDIDDTSHELAAAQRDGKSVVLVFWASWCRYCAREAPSIVKAQKLHADKAVFFGVVTGKDELVDEKKVRTFVERNGVTYPTLRDRDLILSKRFEVKGVPTVVVISADGKISYEGHHAPKSWENVL